MSSEKPKTGMKHPHSESHVPKEAKPKKKHVLRNAALGVAAAVGLGGLAAGCAPSARAQETTPRPRIEMVQSTDARVAPATAPSPPRPETRVAEAASASARGYASTSAGPDPDMTQVSQDDVMQVLVPLIESSRTYERDIRSNPPTNWVVEASRGPLGSDPFVNFTVYANTPNGKVKVASTLAEPVFRMYEIPTAETPAVGAGIFVLVDSYVCQVFYFDKSSGSYKSIGYGGRGDFLDTNDYEVAINVLSSRDGVNIMVAASSSFTRSSGAITGVVPGAHILMHSITLVGEPGAGVAYIQVME